MEIYEAMKYSHQELNLIHRDLKPANILLKNGIPKIADYGISKDNFNEGLSHTIDIGTNNYKPY